MQRVSIGPVRTLRTYNTGLWTSPSGPEPSYVGKAFSYGARYYRYRGLNPFEEQERLSSSIGHFPVTDVDERLQNGDHRWQSAVELLIFASSHDHAKRAANLLFAAMLVYEGRSFTST